MKSNTYLPSAIALLALPTMIVRADDAPQAGKTSTATAKTSTVASPGLAKPHSDAAAGDTAPGNNGSDAATKPVDADHTTGEKPAPSAGEAKDAADKAAAPPVAGNNGSVGGTKASK